MYTIEEKMKKMSIFGNIEIKYIEKPDHFRLVLPVKVRPVGDTSYLIELDAVCNDIYGKTIEESINKMFDLLTSESRIVEAFKKGRFQFINGEFIKIS